MAEGGRITRNFAARAGRAIAYVEGLVPAAEATDLRRPRRPVEPLTALVMAELTCFPELAAPAGRRAVTLAPAVVLRRDPRGAAWINLLGDLFGADLQLEARLRDREETFEFNRGFSAEELAEGLRDLGLPCDVHFGGRWKHEGWQYDPGRWLVTTDGPAWRSVSPEGSSFEGDDAAPLLDDLRVRVVRLDAGPLPGVEIVPTPLRPTRQIRPVHAPLTVPPGLPTVTAGSEAIIERGPDGWTVRAWDPHDYGGAAPLDLAEETPGLNPYHYRPGVPWQLAAADAAAAEGGTADDEDDEDGGEESGS